MIKDKTMKDMFENVPKQLEHIFNDETPDYQKLESWLKECKVFGFTFEYGLDCVPFNLRPFKYVQVKTKSNFRNLNGMWLPIKEIANTRVTCFVDTEFGGQHVDFYLPECVDFSDSPTPLHPLFQSIMGAFVS